MSDMVVQLIHDAVLGGGQSFRQELLHQEMLEALLHCDQVVSNYGNVFRVPSLVYRKLRHQSPLHMVRELPSMNRVSGGVHIGIGRLFHGRHGYIGERLFVYPSP